MGLGLWPIDFERIRLVTTSDDTWLQEVWGYTHDCRADKYPYPHDRRTGKDSYPHDRNVTDYLCSLIKLCFAFLWLIFQLNLFYSCSCWKLFTLGSVSGSSTGPRDSQATGPVPDPETRQWGVSRGLVVHFILMYSMCWYSEPLNR